jgi:hypothetical protein
MRKVFQQTIGPREIQNWHPLLEGCTSQMLLKIINHPAGLGQHVREYVLTVQSMRTIWLTKSISHSGAIIIMITFGYQVQEGNDPLVQLAQAAVDTFSRATLPAAFLVDTLPIRAKKRAIYVI